MAKSGIDAHSIVYLISEDMQTSSGRRMRARLARKIAKDPTAELYIRLAFEEARRQNWTDAQTAVASALTLTPGQADAMLLKAQLLEAARDYGAAEQAYEAVITQHSDFSKAYREYGRFFMSENTKFTLAQTMLLRALELHPRDALAHLLLAELLLKRNKTSQALLHLEIAKRFQEAEPLFHGRAVELFVELEQYEEAVRQLKLARKYDPKNKRYQVLKRELQNNLSEQNQPVKQQFWKRWKAK